MFLFFLVTWPPNPGNVCSEAQIKGGIYFKKTSLFLFETPYGSCHAGFFFGNIGSGLAFLVCKSGVDRKRFCQSFTNNVAAAFFNFFFNICSVTHVCFYIWVQEYI